MKIEPERDQHSAPPRDAARAAAPVQPKAAYAPPTLTRYGTVRELTKGGSGSNIDGANHTKK